MPLCISRQVYPTPLCSDCQNTSRIGFTVQDLKMMLTTWSEQAQECEWCKRKTAHLVFYLSEPIRIVLSRKA